VIIIKKIYLTIDDGPTKDTSRKLEVMRKQNLLATWFCLGENIEQYFDVLVQAVQEGHIIASHSYEHKVFSELTVEEGIEQIRKTDVLIEKIYEKANIMRPIKLFRFPRGDLGVGDSVTKNEHTMAFESELIRLGYKNPQIKGITYDYWTSKGYNESIQTYCTFIIPDKSLLLGKDEINKADDVLQAMEKEHNGSTLFKGASAEIPLFHDFVELPHVFNMIIERFAKAEAIFMLPK